MKFKDEAAAKDAAAKEADKKKAADKLKLPEPKVTSESKVISLSDYPKTIDLRQLMSKPGVKGKLELDVIGKLWTAVTDLVTYEPLTQPEPTALKVPNMIPVANTATPEALVDYSRVYYLNSPRPWVGSSQVNIKVASDGTITEGAAQVQSQTLSTILSALPINTVLTAVAKSALSTGAALSLKEEMLSKLGIEGQGFGPENTGGPYETETTVELELTVQQDNYRHVHTGYVDFSLPCKAADDGVVKLPYALTIETSAGGAIKKEEDNTVKVSGTVVLPKSAPTAPNAPATPK